MRDASFSVIKLMQESTFVKPGNDSKQLDIRQTMKYFVSFNRSMVESYNFSGQFNNQSMKQISFD